MEQEADEPGEEPTGLLARLASVPDPRSRHGRRYPLKTLLGIAVAAVLSGAKTYTEVGEFAAELSQAQLAAMVIPAGGGAEARGAASRGYGGAALLTIRLEGGAVLKALHGFLAGGQWSWVRLHGDHGLMENLRGDQRRLRVVLERHDGDPTEEVLLPTAGLPASMPPLGDGAAELLMLRDFAAALRRGEQPEQDVHFGVAVSITGIQAHRSALRGGIMIPLPDLRDPAERRRFAEDDWCPRRQ